VKREALAELTLKESLTQDLIRLRLVALFLLSHLHSDLALALVVYALPMEVLLAAFDAIKPLLVSDATELLEARSYAAMYHTEMEAELVAQAAGLTVASALMPLLVSHEPREHRLARALAEQLSLVIPEELLCEAGDRGGRSLMDAAQRSLVLRRSLMCLKPGAPLSLPDAAERLPLAAVFLASNNPACGQVGSGSAGRRGKDHGASGASTRHLGLAMGAWGGIVSCLPKRLSGGGAGRWARRKRRVVQWCGPRWGGGRRRRARQAAGCACAGGGRGAGAGRVRSR